MHGSNNRSGHKVGILSSWYNFHVLQLSTMQVLFSCIIGTLGVLLALPGSIKFFEANGYFSYPFRSTLTSEQFGRFAILVGREMLLLTYYVPITVIITLEVIRIVEANFIGKDQDIRFWVPGGVLLNIRVSSWCIWSETRVVIHRF